MISIIPLSREALNAAIVVRSLVRRRFHESTETYTAMTQNDFHTLVSLVQFEINALKIGRRIVGAMRKEIQEFMGDDDIMLQKQMYLRAARPSNGRDIVGWHRESFYGTPPQTFNLWMPVVNVATENTLQYVPDSESIPTSELTIVQELDRSVVRDSPSHRIGLLYAPKVIRGGVDFSTAERLEVPENYIALFSGEL